MSDDIVTRLRRWASPDPDNQQVNELHRAADEIERLRKALELAVGELSTYGPYKYTSPDELCEYYKQAARRD